MEDGVVRVNPYTFDDVVAALNKTWKYDWVKFLRSRLDRTGGGAPLQGLTLNGWKLDYQDSRNDYQKLLEKERKSVDEMYSIGLSLDQHGKVVDVLAESPAASAGIAAGMTLVAVDGRAWEADRFRTAIATTTTTGSMELLTENQGFYANHKLSYSGGARYPVLTPIAHAKDGLAQVLKAR